MRIFSSFVARWRRPALACLLAGLMPSLVLPGVSMCASSTSENAKTLFDSVTKSPASRQNGARPAASSGPVAPTPPKAPVVPGAPNQSSGQDNPQPFLLQPGA